MGNFGRIFVELGADFLYDVLAASSSRLENNYRPGGADFFPRQPSQF